jgi:energy-coupling factor transport system ATP-binding protein
MQEEMIRTENLTFAYQTIEEGADGQTITHSKIALEDVNLTIHAGEFVAILGHNGSGKSTLAKHLNGICLPTGGKVYVAGMDTSDPALLYEIRKKAGMVFQNPDNQIIATIVEEDVAFAPENLGVPTPEIRQRVDDALKAVDMYEYRGHAPHLLSGGQKQRVAIAGILAMQPQCIVLDEPTAMLDPKGRQEVMSVITRLNRESGVTIVLITHHMEEACQASRVIVMDDGHVLLDGTPREIFTQTQTLHASGLAAPQTVEILDQLNQHGAHLPTDALSVSECADRLQQYLEA